MPHYANSELVALYEVFADIMGLREGPHDWPPSVQAVADFAKLSFSEAEARLVKALGIEEPWASPEDYRMGDDEAEEGDAA